MELVLYYGTNDPGMKKHEMMMKSVLVRMGVKIRNVKPEQVMETIGCLAGMPGFQERKNVDEPLPVMKDFTGSRIDTLLYQLRKVGVPKIDLKAIVTEHNCGWSFYKLYEELKEEHRLMTEQAQASQMEAGASDGEGSL